MPEQLQFSPAHQSELMHCAQVMKETDPWLTYQFSSETCAGILRWRGGTLFIGRLDGPVGFVLIHPRGFLGSPYIAVLAVAAGFRGRGVGAQLLRFAEAQLSGSRHVYLCVSSFNVRAVRFYELHGYACVGEIPDFIADGFSELLMQKRLS